MLDTMRRPPECDGTLRCTHDCCAIPGSSLFFVLFVVLAQFIMYVTPTCAENAVVWVMLAGVARTLLCGYSDA